MSDGYPAFYPETSARMQKAAPRLDALRRPLYRGAISALAVYRMPKTIAVIKANASAPTHPTYPGSFVVA